MSQLGLEEDNSQKAIYGAVSKTRYESYNDEELASDEFFWNQLRIIVEMKNKEYFYYFLHEKEKYIERMSDL